MNEYIHLDSLARALAMPDDFSSMPGHVQVIYKAAHAYYKNQWQPIDTAPKDGNEVLLFEPGSDYTFVGKWDKDHYDGPSWICTEYNAFNKQPTHWMPLPAPPDMD